jgi:hypothetical protein
MVNTWSAPQVHNALIGRIADTYLGYVPRDTQTLAPWWPSDSAREANERMLTTMRSTTPPRVPLAAFAGRFDHPVFGPIWIRLADAPAGLTLQMGDGQIADLEYHGGDSFYVLWRDAFVREYYGTHVTFNLVGDSVVSFTTTLNRDQFTARKAVSTVN